MDADKIRQTIAGYQAALVADAASPQANYTLDGKTVDRQGWREGLQRLVGEWQKLLNGAEPYYVATKQIL